MIFLRLGVTAFGGPAAHIAMMRAEFVDRRKLITEEEFLDLVGASNLLPGPSSTEVGILIGYRLCGWLGLALAGVCFILPAMLIVMALAWAYVRFGHLPETGALLYGIKPVIIAIIAQAIWGLGRTALKSTVTIIAAAAVFLLSFAHVSPLTLLFASGCFLAFRQCLGDWRLTGLVAQSKAMRLIVLIFLTPVVITVISPLLPHRLTDAALFLTFVKIGTSVFGSGYVLLAFLKTELVSHLHWISNAQLLDSVAIGQFTPGPVFTTATFIGYLLKGPVGALVATAGIFLPAFLFVAVAGHLVTHIRQSKIAGAFLDGVNAAAVALMTYAGCQLAVSAIFDWFTACLCIVSGIILFKFKINSAWLVLGGGAAGLVFKWIG